MKSNLFFLLWLMFLVSYIRNHCLCQGQKDWCLYFPLIILVLAPTMRCLINFEWNFVYSVSNFIELSQHNFSKRLFSCIEFSWHPCWNQLTADGWIAILSHWSMSLSHCLYYCIIIISLEWGDLSPLTLFSKE